MVEEISSCKNLNDQTKSERLNIVDSEAVFKAIEANLASSTWGVSGELYILNSNGVSHLHNQGKSTRICRIVPQVTKIFIAKHFDSPSYKYKNVG